MTRNLVFLISVLLSTATYAQGVVPSLKMQNASGVLSDSNPIAASLKGGTPASWTANGTGPISATIADRSQFGYSVAVVNITSIGSGGTITFQSSGDNSSWRSTHCLRDDGIWSNDVSYSGNTFYCPLGDNYFRANVTAFTGPSTLTGTASFSQVNTGIPLNGGFQTVGLAPPAVVAPALAPSNYVAGSASNGGVVKASSGLLHSIYATCSSACYLMVFNNTTVPGDGATTAGTSSGNLMECIPIAAGATGKIGGDGVLPTYFSAGISVAISSTACSSKTASSVGFIRARYQ